MDIRSLLLLLLLLFIPALPVLVEAPNGLYPVACGFIPPALALPVWFWPNPDPKPAPNGELGLAPVDWLGRPPNPV